MEGSEEIMAIITERFAECDQCHCTDRNIGPVGLFGQPGTG